MGADYYEVRASLLFSLGISLVLCISCRSGGYLMLHLESAVSMFCENLIVLLIPSFRQMQTEDS